MQVTCESESGADERCVVALVMTQHEDLSGYSEGAADSRAADEAVASTSTSSSLPAAQAMASSPSSSSIAKSRSRDADSDAASTSKIDVKAPLPASAFYQQQPGNFEDPAARSDRRPRASSSLMRQSHDLSTAPRAPQAMVRRPSTRQAEPATSSIRSTAVTDWRPPSNTRRTKRGWTTSKVIQTGDDPSCHGVWISTAWDFVLKGPQLVEPKYKPAGSSVRYAAALPLNSSAPSAWRRASSPSQPTETDTQERYVEKSYTTVTPDELETARPFRTAFFSRKKWCWLVMVRINAQCENSQVRVPMWLEADDTPLHATDISPPFAPALPARPEDVVERGNITLATMQSTTGYTVAYTDEDYHVYPAVVPRALWDAFLDNCRKNPPMQHPDPRASMYAGVALLLRLVDNVLFRGEPRPVPVSGNVFQKQLAWSPETYAVFVVTVALTLLIFRLTNRQKVLIDTLGFSLTDSEKSGPALQTPDVSLETDEGRMNRARMLRFWLEAGIWIEDFKLRLGTLPLAPCPAPGITLKKATGVQLEILGGDDLPRQPGESWQVAGQPGGLDPEWAACFDTLGATPDLSDEVLTAIYEQQVNMFDPENAIHYFSALDKIGMQRQSRWIGQVVAAERQHGRYTEQDLRDAYRIVFNSDASDLLDKTDEAVMEAFTAVLPATESADERTRLIRACELIARDRQSDLIRATIQSMEEQTRPRMELKQAWEALGGAPGLDDTMVIALFEIRLQDQPNQESTLHEALTVVGESMQSTKVKHYLETGKKEEQWEAAPVVNMDKPVGLTNIANTCYLNSLLQYFFTVRELRDSILHFQNGLDANSIPADLLNRVGGRQITRKEVERSVRFVELLKGLYQQLLDAPVSAVTPETELAYLALVPNKEEMSNELVVSPVAESSAEAEPPKSTTDPEGDSAMADRDSSDGTLTGLSTGPLSPSILGKRNNEHLDSQMKEAEPNPLDLAEPPRQPLAERDTNVAETVDEPSRSKRAMSEAERASASTDLVAAEAADGVVEILPADQVPRPRSTAPPPLPPRPKAPAKHELERQVSEYMAFGRQNDVTECMDNVMFQLECALNPTVTSDAAAVSLVKRTFYGKMKQQLDFLDAPAEPSRTQEEPFFSLLVDVAEEGRDVYDGLDTVFDDVPVEIDGKQAARRISLVEVPTLLQIQLQRVQYDRVAKRIYKSNAHMAFGAELSLDRYLDIDSTDAAAVARRDRTVACRRQLEAARAQLLELRPQRTQSLGTHLREAIDFVGSIKDELGDIVMDDFAELAAAEVNDLESDIGNLEKKIASLREEMSSMWSDSQQAVYELVAVFMHRGTATSGHYFLYQRDSKDHSKWRKYNDSIVTDVNPADEVFCERTGDVNPYFLVYCRKDKLDAISSERGFAAAA